MPRRRHTRVRPRSRRRTAKGILSTLTHAEYETTKPEVEGYAYSLSDDNGGSLYTEEQIKAKLRTDKQSDNYGGGRIFVNGSWVDLDQYFNSNYRSLFQQEKHKPKFENGVYTPEQRERFKASTSALLERLKAKGGEITSQIEKLTESLELSPWTPKEYQESHVAGLKANLQELEKFQGALQEVITGYDKMLITSDAEKLTDPKA
jgi:hypothetical protein